MEETTGPKLVICTPHSVRPAMLGTFIEQMIARREPGFLHAKDLSAITQFVGVNERALLVLSIFETDELLGALQFLATIESRISQGLIKIHVITRAHHPKITTLLKSKGVSDVSDFHLSGKAFQYKVRQGLQLLQQQNVKEVSAKAVEIATQTVTKPTGQVRWLTEIEHDADFWLVLNPKHIRFVIGKWFMNLYGPGPSAGVWQDSGLMLNGEKGWVFQPRSGAGDPAFFKGEGRWMFFGNCPEYSWSLGLWYFISPRPHFAFYVNGDIQLEKAWIADGVDFGIRKNSNHARSLQSLIQSTLEASIYLKNDKIVSKDLSIELGTKPVTELNGSFEIQESIELYRKFEEQKAAEIKRAREAYERTKILFAITSKNGVAVRYENCLELIALREKQAILNVPHGILTTGDRISLEAQFQQGDEPARVVFTATTRVIGTEETESRVAAVFELDQTIENHFIELVKMFRTRRESLLKFFLKAKGV